MWVIYAVHLRKYLNAESGWGEEGNATRYSWGEKQTTALPFSSVWRKAQVTEKTVGFGK